MQEARAFCDDGGSGPPGSLPLSSQPSLPRHPSFSLHLYDRFVRDSETGDPFSHYPENHNLMKIEVDAADATPGVLPSAVDAINLPVSSLSSSSGITTLLRFDLCER